MKTTFILHGGATSRKNPHNDSYFFEFTKNLKDGDHVLFVGFARESADEEQKVFERDKKAILEHTDKLLVVEKAELDSFTAQLQKSDVVYVTGGNTKILKERLSKACINFGELLKGKVYAGSSAGAYAVSTYHISGHAEGVQEGLGILPICTMAHYGNPEFNAAKDNVKWFDDYIQNCELVLLPECEWIVKEI